MSFLSVNIGHLKKRSGKEKSWFFTLKGNLPDRGRHQGRPPEEDACCLAALETRQVVMVFIFCCLDQKPNGVILSLFT